MTPGEMELFLEPHYQSCGKDISHWLIITTGSMQGHNYLCIHGRTFNTVSFNATTGLYEYTYEWHPHVGALPLVTIPTSAGDISSVVTKLSPGDIGVLKASNRTYKILEERKDEGGNFEELVQFDDDTRHPVWILHGQLIEGMK